MTEAAHEGGGVQGRLWRMAAERARENGFEFSPDSEHLFRDRAEAAARRMVRRSGGGGDGDADAEGGGMDWELARANTERLVDEMAAVAREMGFPRLQERTLGEALARLCPLWPFC